MNLAAAPIVAGAPLEVLLPSLHARRAFAAVVWCGMTTEAGLAAVRTFGVPIHVLDARNERFATLPAGCCGHRGRPARTLADLRRQLPAATLFVFGPDVDDDEVRAAAMFAARDEGALAIALDPLASHARLGALLDALQRWSPEHHADVHLDGLGDAWLVASPPPRAHVTFLIEKYTHAYGASGISINLDNLVETLRATGRASCDVVHYDERFHAGRPVQLADVQAPPGTDVHVVVTTLHYHSHANPTPELLQGLRRRGCKVVMVWLDKKISRSTPEYYAAVDVNCVLDGTDFELPGAWPIFTPKNPRFFRDAGLDRDLPVSLVGEVRYLAQRKAIVERLRTETRVPVQLFGTSAADPQHTRTVAEYAALYQRSRISLALTKDTVRQLKGRVFEIVHCGALLCCDVNHHVQQHFAPGREYVEYHDYEHLVDRLQYFLAHDDERAAIAAAGHRRATVHYSHDVFWRALLSRCGASAAAFRHSPGEA
jgi:hypothetical protein